MFYYLHGLPLPILLFLLLRRPFDERVLRLEKRLQRLQIQVVIILLVLLHPNHQYNTIIEGILQLILAIYHRVVIVEYVRFD